MSLTLNKPFMRQIALAIALAVSIITSAPATAAEIRLNYSNDPAAGNDRPDDLYTSDIELEIITENWKIVAGERMFTDRQIGHRFDETHLSIVRPLGTIRGWDAEVSAGLMQAGKGLLGQSLQNEVHRAIGSEEVFLPYIPSSHLHGTAGALLSRPLGTVGGSSLRSDVEAHVAPDWRNWVRISLVAQRPLGASTALEIGVGARADEVETAWIGPEVGGTSPTGHLSFIWRSTEVRWTWNEYGTRSPHLFIGFRSPIKRNSTPY